MIVNGSSRDITDAPSTRDAIRSKQHQQLTKLAAGAGENIICLHVVDHSQSLYHYSYRTTSILQTFGPKSSNLSTKEDMS